MDPVAHHLLGAPRPIRRQLVLGRQPAHEQSGGLQDGEDLLGARVVGQVPCGSRAHDLVAGQAQQQMALAGLERCKDLGGDLIGHRRAAGGVPIGGREGVRGGGDRARRQDDEGAPALGPLEDRLEHRRVLGARVLDDESGRLGRVHAQELAAEGRGVPEELRHQPGSGRSHRESSSSRMSSGSSLSRSSIMRSVDGGSSWASSTTTSRGSGVDSCPVRAADPSRRLQPLGRPAGVGVHPGGALHGSPGAP